MRSIRVRSAAGFLALLGTAGLWPWLAAADLTAQVRVDLAWRIALRPEMRIRRAPAAGSRSRY